MKRVGIVTINDNNNYGNRLQNYAVQNVLENYVEEVVTIKNIPEINTKEKFLFKCMKHVLRTIKRRLKRPLLRREKFLEFNKYIKYSKGIVTPYSKISKKYDYFVVGSDQVWNPNFKRLSDVDLLCFANNNQKIAFSASFGVEKLPENKYKYVKENIETFKSISVREDAGKKILERIIQKKDIEVLIDPTMLLNSYEWDKVAKKPQQLENINSKKYILNYFLGELTDEWNSEINRIAKENDCEIINILDKNSPFYQTGPSEFLYLEKNAFMVCTDSFHSSVFSIIYDTPFVVFERKDEKASMSSRIDTLLSKFNLQNRKFTGSISKDLLKCDYSEAKKILEIEKEKSISFLKRALDID